MHNIEIGTSGIRSSSVTAVSGRSLEIIYAPAQLHPPVQQSLAALIAEHEAKRKFYYGIEVSARNLSPNSLPLDYNDFSLQMPLFTSIVWLAAMYADVEPLESTDAVQLTQKLQEHTVVLPHLAAYRLNQKRLDAYLAFNFSNMLAIRGDLVDDTQPFKITLQMLQRAREIRGNSISIGVAGYPERHPDTTSFEEDIKNLRQKVEAGADFIITQICYSVSVIKEFVRNCRKNNINVPIVVGIVIPENMFTLKLLSKLTNVNLSGEEMSKILAIQNEPKKFRDYFQNRAFYMIKDIMESNLDIYGFQFFTLNKFSSIVGMLKQLRDSGIIEG